MRLARLVFRSALLIIFAIALSLTSRNATTESLTSGEPQGLVATIVKVMMRAFANVRTTVLFDTNHDGMVGGVQHKDHSAALGFVVTDVGLVARTRLRSEATRARLLDKNYGPGSRPAELDSATEVSVHDADEG